jgi:adenosylmethionine-8-amino-7-oxononanoate aminotransferase
MIGGTQDVFYSRAAIVALPLIVRAAGIRMWDEAGNEYIDASCGPLVSCLGHGNERVIEAMASQARRLDYAFSLVARNQLPLLQRKICHTAAENELVRLRKWGCQWRIQS